MRRALALALVPVAVAAIALGAPPAPAVAAGTPGVQVGLAAPCAPARVPVRVAAVGADGTAAAFRGTVTLSVGSTRSTVAVTGDSSGVAVVAVPTTVLKAGRATLKAVVRVGGRSVTVVREGFVELTAPFTVRGFSCAAVPPSGGTVRWTVDHLLGVPVRTPNSRDLPLLPYVPSSTPRWAMTGADGLPLRTSGTMTIESGGKVVAKRALPRTVRKLVFGAPTGALRAGTYIARLTLLDPAGRPATATQPLVVVAKGTAPCSA